MPLRARPCDRHEAPERGHIGCNRRRAMLWNAILSSYYPFAGILFLASVVGAVIVAAIDSSQPEVVEPEVEDRPLDPNLN